MIFLVIILASAALGSARSQARIDPTVFPAPQVHMVGQSPPIAQANLMLVDRQSDFRARSAANEFARDKPGDGCHIAMRANSIAKAISAAIACVGLAVAVGGATLGATSPHREVLIVAGIDSIAIGVAAFILVIIFFSETAPPPPVRVSPRMRSLDNPEGEELKKMLVRHVARDKPVTIGFPGDDPEAERFAAQIGQFLHENNFTVVDFAAEAPTVRLDPGIGIDDGNHILVGPIGSRASTAPSIETLLPAGSRPRSPKPAEPMQANGLNSP